MAIGEMSDGDGPTSPLSSDGMVRPPKVRPNLYDLLQQIESRDDDVSRRVAQAACDSDTSGSDHAANDDDSDSEASMCCEFVDSMAAESRSDIVAVCNRTKAPPARTRIPAKRITSRVTLSSAIF